MKIFFSYPHDHNAPLVERIKADLEARGHEVWFDADQIKSGDDWRNAITRGILDSQQVVAFLSKHAVRDPGVCLNEIAIALADKGEAMVTVLVEPETEVSTPVSITHIQWLKMDAWQEQMQDDGWYRTQLDRLIDAIENPSHAGRNEELETLRLALDPMSFYAEIAPHIPGFTGRRWIIDRYTAWLDEEPNSRVLRLEGGPGLGKTAVASYLAHSTRSSVLAVHLCQYNKGESRNPLRLVRTLAYQLATRLPDYRARLLKSVAIQRPETMQGKDPASLWGELISTPLAGGGKGMIDRQRLAIIIDGLDEATVDGKNPIVELLATEINQLPKWIGVVLTGRPDPELTQRLARYQPMLLSDDDPQNLADLKVYVNDWLTQEVKAGKLTEPQAQAASAALLARSQGAFLYLSQARIAVTENMLDLTQPTQFPSGLTEIYQRFFERRFSDPWNSDSSYKTKIRPLLELVLASSEPLPIAIAKNLLKWGPYDGPEVIRSLGSLLKRAKGGLAGEDEETLAPFHNSVREWLQDADAAGDFHVSPDIARVPLTEAIWKRYLDSQEKDAYAWQVLPDLLPMLSEVEQDTLFGEPNWETSQVLKFLAECVASKLRFNEAATTWRIQLRFSERLAAAVQDDFRIPLDLAGSYNNLGSVEKTLLGNPRAALGFYRQGLGIAERLSAAAPENAEYARDLSISYNNLGDIEQALGNSQAALGFYRQGLAIRERLSAAAPENAQYARDLSISYDNLGRIEQALGNSQAALGFYRQVLGVAERLSAAAPENAEYARDLSTSYDNIGYMEQILGNSQTALEYYRQGLGIRERMAAADPKNKQVAYGLSTSYNNIGYMEQILGNSQTTLEYYQQGLGIRERMAAADPGNFHLARGLSISYDNLGDIEHALGNSQDALGFYRQGLAICERLSAAAPENAQYARDLCVSYWKLASSSEGEESKQWWGKAYAVLQSMHARGILAKDDEQYLVEVKAKLGEP